MIYETEGEALESIRVTVEVVETEDCYRAVVHAPRYTVKEWGMTNTWSKDFSRSYVYQDAQRRAAAAYGVTKVTRVYYRVMP